MTSPLAQNARIVAELRERLKTEYPDLQDGDAVLEDTLQGASALPEMLARLAREIEDDEADAEATKAIAHRKTQRAADLKARADRKRGSLCWALQEAGLKRIPRDVLPDLVVTLSTPTEKPLIIPNDVVVPHFYCRPKYEPNRTFIRERLESGEKLDFAFLGNAKPVLTIKKG